MIELKIQLEIVLEHRTPVHHIYVGSEAEIYRMVSALGFTPQAEKTLWKNPSYPDSHSSVTVLKLDLNPVVAGYIIFTNVSITRFFLLNTFVKKLNLHPGELP